MTEEHKNKVCEILMDDYDIRPALAKLITKVFVESAEQVIREDEMRMKERGDKE